MTGAIHTRRFEIEAFVTKDGSVIRELMHPATHASRAQSLAEATLDPDTITVLHRHHASEELYFILEGSAEMTLGARCSRRCRRYRVHRAGHWTSYPQHGRDAIAVLVLLRPSVPR